MDKNELCKKVSAGMLLLTMSLYATPVFAYSKDETVYSKLNSEGNSYKTIVSTHLKNTDSENTLNDMTNLTNIKNTNGDEKFSQNGNSLIWDAQKHDIYYQGESENELPISCSVKYELDGEEISAKDIAGKSGKVKVTINYENKSENLVNINGKTQKLYTPFVVVAGTMINNKNNRNIEVSNGKVIDDGTKTVVLGVALPGLQESLNISKDKVDIPSSIEITMDATNFEMGSIMNYVTPKLLEDEDIESFDGLDELYSQVETLQSSINKIEEGAQELYNGSTKVSDGASQIYENLNTVNTSLEEIKNGNISLDEGLKLVLNGLKETKTLLNNSSSSDNIDQINNLMNMNTFSINQMTTGLNTLKSTYEKFNLQNLSNTDILRLSKEFYQSINLPITTEEEATEMNIKLLNVKYTYESSYETNNNLISLLQGNNMALEDTINTFNTLNTEINTLISTLEENITKLEIGASTLSLGTTTLSDGVKLLTEKIYEFIKKNN